MKWYIHCIKNYANFSGRARRKEYWMFFLFNLFVFFILGIISNLISDIFGTEESFLLIGAYGLFIIIPHIACAVRRLHDINKSGVYWFVRFIPLIGPIWLLILLVEDSWDGQNKYGANPKNLYNDDEINFIGKE
ncbi:DUF805 domain-containing protein [Polaribacter aquimarinus]|uniref:DUF805 domain-containing protein n=1 Tax=Polaribacter aquimarinus TaxID=2100726 RepID=A0A2U2J7W9_9FLAO|nr:DUF805 domain-containing protein [Polaribacter aquimarinus]PWG04414.1 DUF805 domain-containing protein [Polaribacter aquimarinus]